MGVDCVHSVVAALQEKISNCNTSSERKQLEVSPNQAYKVILFFFFVVVSLWLCLELLCSCFIVHPIASMTWGTCVCASRTDFTCAVWVTDDECVRMFVQQMGSLVRNAGQKRKKKETLMAENCLGLCSPCWSWPFVLSVVCSRCVRTSWGWDWSRRCWNRNWILSR